MRRLFFLCVCVIYASMAWGLSSVQRATFRLSVCSIYVKASRACYTPIASWQGTGFICDKKRGLICTNHHVVGRSGVVATYDVEFMDGQKLEARLLYADPWHDFAILEITEPNLIPSDVKELDRFADPKLGESIYIAGNNEGQSFSFQEGRVSDLYTGWGFMPEPSFGCLVNATGGSSGSPVVNDKLEVVGVNFAGFGDGRCLEIRSSCIKDALSALKKRTLPQRRHVGVILDLASLERQLKLFSYPRSEAEAYLKKFPQAGFRLLEVKGCLKGSPAEGIFETGDALVSVNGQAVGPDLALFEKLLNEALENRVKIGFYRHGQLIEKNVPLYNLHDCSIKHLVVFGGATFFEADDLMRWQFGLEPGQILVKHVLPGSAFSALARGAEEYSVFLTSLTGIQDLLEKISKWERQKDFFFECASLTPLHSGSDAIFFQNPLIKRATHISYKTSENSPPEFLNWSFERGWQNQSQAIFMNHMKQANLRQAG